MLLAAFGTFLMTASLTYLLWRKLFGQRRAVQVLEKMESTAQRATQVKMPNLLERWEQGARQAGLSWTGRTYLISAGLGLTAAALLSLGGHLGPAAAAAAAGIAGPWAVVNYRQQRRAAQFAEQLPAALTLAANTIRAGGTMLQAIKAIARQMPEPTRGEFMRVEQALQLQVPLGTALEQARERIGAEEFAAVVVACKVGGQAGADLGTVLENIAREIVEDREFRRSMRAASAEGRMSARIVTAIPLVAGAYFLWSNPSYFDPILTSPGGKLLLVGCIGSIGLGWLIISRLTDVRAW